MTEFDKDAPFGMDATLDLLKEVLYERMFQHNKFGRQTHPDFQADSVESRDGLNYDAFGRAAEAWKQHNNTAFKEGRGDWTGILMEEVYEAVAESDYEELRTELIQVAAVALAWVDDLDRRNSG